jgi:hypothetical protein
MAFNVERFDEAGNRLPPVPVELRGRSLEGGLHEGDSVDVTPTFSPHGTVRVGRFRNLTTGADVSVTCGRHSWIYWSLFAVTGLIVLVISVVAVLIIVNVLGTFPDSGF